MTGKKLQEILNTMVILVDTREQKNDHILDYFRANNIPYKFKKLNCADYSCEISLNGELVDLSNVYAIERKGSLNEIVGNVTTDRVRFFKELERAKTNNIGLHLLLETATWRKIWNGSYRSKANPNSISAVLQSISTKYNIPITMLSQMDSPRFIYENIYYFARNFIKTLDTPENM